MYRSNEGWREEYRKRGALLVSHADKKDPHFVLHSGLHTQEYCDSNYVTQDPLLLGEIASDLLAVFTDLVFSGRDVLLRVNRVVGPAMGAITLAYEIARNLNTDPRRKKSCLCGYVGKENMVQGDNSRNSIIEKGEIVLLVEDVVTSGASIQRAASAVEKAGAIPIPFIVSPVNRSSGDLIVGRRVISLFALDSPVWPADKCPYCRSGSDPISDPKNKI